LRQHADLVDIHFLDFFGPVVFVKDDLVVTGEDVIETLLVSLEVSDRQPRDDVDRHVDVGILALNRSGNGERENFDEFGYQFLLVEGEVQHRRLLLGQIADEKGVTADGDMEELRFVRIAEIHPELQIGGVSVNRFKYDGIGAVGCFGKSKADVDAQDFHFRLRGSPMFPAPGISSNRVHWMVGLHWTIAARWFLK